MHKIGEVLTLKKLYMLGPLAVMLALCLPPQLYASGRYISTQTAEGIDVWQKEFEVGHLAPGTYNFIVNAKDKAGNIGVSGPFNIKIDPFAGLPEMRVVYPEPGQIIRNSFTLVGVATARYGISQVLVKFDNGEFEPVNGDVYWSRNVPSDSISQGPHTIQVKGIDSKGVEGPVTTSSFILDLAPPEVELINHEIGDIISGNVTIQGRIFDPNGVENAFLSADGVNFKPLHLRRKGGEAGLRFSFPIRTKKLPDGPIVYYVRATDKTGLSVVRPFLFFIDNLAPEIVILSPLIGEDTFGKTQVTGRVIDDVGLKEFYYEWAGERADIPLRPGDPFWSVVFPISMANNRAVPFRVTAVDKSGNVTTVTQRFQDTRRYRTPTLVIDYPKPSLGVLSLAADQPIYGHILEGFFPSVVVMENQIESIDAGAAFRIDPDLISEGRSTFRLWAQDEDDTLGQPITVRVNRAALPANRSLPYSPISIDSPEAYSWFGDSVTVNGYIDDFSPGSGIAVQYRFDPEDPWKNVDVNNRGSFKADISLASLPEGFVHLEFRTVRGGRGDIPYYLPINKFVKLPFITFLTPQLQFGTVHGNVTTTGMLEYYVPIAKLEYSLNGRTFEELDFTAKWGRAWFNYLCDYTALEMNRQTLIIRATDRAGNVVSSSPEIEFDNSMDLPVTLVNAPLDDDLVTGDFQLSGLAYDDDGLAAVYWRILTPRNPWDPVATTLARRANTEFQRVETTQNFAITLTLDDVSDGENIIEIFAEDIYGVAGEKVSRTIRVSTAPPEVTVQTPAMEAWNKGNLMASGTVFDRNGFESLTMSMDNGASYQIVEFKVDEEGAGTWNLSINTKAYKDGVYSLLIRAIDKYGLPSFSAGIVNIDNTPPEISLGSPNNGDRFSSTLPITGQAFDNIGLAKISGQLVNIRDPRQQVTFDLPGDFVVMEQLQVSSFPDGYYNLKITALDQAGNEMSVTRDIILSKVKASSEIALYNPMPGIDHSGPLVVSGRVTGAIIPSQVVLRLNHRQFTNVEVDRWGIFKYEFESGQAGGDEESVVFAASFTTPAGELISSYDNEVKLFTDGPVVTIDSHSDGDIITKRPWFTGRAYNTGLDTEAAGKKKPVTEVTLSFDNGRSFHKVKGTDEWKYRLETSELPPGPLPIIVKANFADGSVAVRRMILTVDTQPPVVLTIAPEENTEYRDLVQVYGTVFDNYDMDSVEITLRPGNKANYAVPGFIQGLYLDFSILGGLNWSTGLGLTFFEDNVKLQFQAGQSPEGRYSGWVLGGKVLGNIYKTTLAPFFGLDWEWWTTSLTMGANFSYFTMEEDEPSLFMGAFLLQWEIIKADMGFFVPEWKYFKSFSFYMEPALWFAPSDVNAKEAWRQRLLISFGLRCSLF